MKVLVTGSSGMVGRNLLERLALKHFVIAAPSSKELDLICKKKVKSFLAEFKPDLIIHCAGFVGGIQANIKDPVNFLELNSLMGINLLTAAREEGVVNFINLASSCMYPKSASNPLRENLLLTGELEPTNEGYALAKIVTTKLCEYIVRQEPELNYRTLIPCNLYGKYDHFDLSRAHLIPSIINKLHSAKLEGNESVTIWGDGSVRREFMYAGDLADFIAFIITDLRNLPQNTNVGNGFDYSVMEYYETAAKVIGFGGNFIFDLTKPIGMKQKLVDISIQSKLGWMPQTSLEAGILNTYKYYTEEVNGV